MIHLLSSDRRKWKEEIKDYSANSMNTFIYVNCGAHVCAMILFENLYF